MLTKKQIEELETIHTLLGRLLKAFASQPKKRKSILTPEEKEKYRAGIRKMSFTQSA